MTISSHFIPEPLLEFGSGQKVEHPQDGLYLYGPVRSTGSPAIIQVGVVGTPDGIALMRQWLYKLQGPLPTERHDQLHTSPWPGFQAAFGARLASDPLVTMSLSTKEIVTAIGKSNRYDAVRSTVKIFETAIRSACASACGTE